MPSSRSDIFTSRGWEIAIGLSATIAGGAGLGLELAQVLGAAALPGGVIPAILLCCMKLRDICDTYNGGTESFIAKSRDLFNSGLALVRGERPVAAVLAQLKRSLSWDLLKRVLFTALGALALNAVGFTTAGVAAHSLAARAQSYFYGANTTGLFSYLQSLGTQIMGPMVGQLVLAGVAVLFTVPAVVYRAFRWIRAWWRGLGVTSER